MILRHGDIGQPVRELQRLLNRQGAKLYADGHFGEGTERALRQFQRDAGLVVDGIAGPATRAALTGIDCSRLLRESDLVEAAAQLQVPLASVHAIAEVESHGAGFLDNGKPKILFERHVFHRRLSAAGFAVDVLAQTHAHLVHVKAGGYVGGAAEHQRLAEARLIHRDIATESASWGAFQIMGWHWGSLDYASAEHFAMSMARSEGDHLGAFVRFILRDPPLLKALRAKRWPQFASLYNGPDYARDLYDVKLARAYERYAAWAAIESAA